MKKPKSKKKYIPKSTAIVDNWQDRMSMPYRAHLINYYTSEIDQQIRPWCEHTFTPDTWIINPVGDGGLGTINFVYERDLTMFLLRWAK